MKEMLGQFDTEATKLDLVGGAKKLGYTPYQVVTIASMIEREAQVDKDRPLVASVIYNRLAANNTLGIDATLLYDDPRRTGRSRAPTWRPIRRTTPACTPGCRRHRSRARARRRWRRRCIPPIPTTSITWRAPRRAGRHRFAVTYQEHLTNVRECLGG